MLRLQRLKLLSDAAKSLTERREFGHNFASATLRALLCKRSSGARAIEWGSSDRVGLERSSGARAIGWGSNLDEGAKPVYFDGQRSGGART